MDEFCCNVDIAQRCSITLPIRLMRNNDVNSHASPSGFNYWPRRWNVGNYALPTFTPSQAKTYQSTQFSQKPPAQLQLPQIEFCSVQELIPK